MAWFASANVACRLFGMDDVGKGATGDAAGSHAL